MNGMYLIITSDLFKVKPLHLALLIKVESTCEFSYLDFLNDSFFKPYIVVQKACRQFLIIMEATVNEQPQHATG